MNNSEKQINTNKLRSSDNTPCCKEINNNSVLSHNDVELKCTGESNKDVVNHPNPNLNTSKSQTNTFMNACDYSNNKDTLNDNNNANHNDNADINDNDDINDNANDVANLNDNDNKSTLVSDSNLKSIVNNNVNPSTLKINNNLESNKQMYNLIAVQLNANESLNQIHNNSNTIHHNAKDNLLYRDKPHSVNMNSGIK